ncbi:MAG: hypothetical protein ACI4JS_11990 [Oscillospiraceae bacterium]
MTKITKRFFSATIVIFTAMTMAFSAGGASAETVDNIEDSSYMLAGHYCYEHDGNYWTNIDGESYLVVNLDEISDNQLNTVSSISGYSVQNYPFASWGNKTQKPVPHGSSYNGSANVTENNDFTPVFKVYPVAAGYGADYRLTLDVKSGSSMNINVFTRTSDAGWSNELKYVKFGLFTKTLKVFLGSNYLMTDAIAFEFMHDSALSGITTFEYEFEAYLPFV